MERRRLQQTVLFLQSAPDLVRHHPGQAPARGRGHLDGLRPEDLFPHDQDHYGGVAATDELARCGADRKRIPRGRFLCGSRRYRALSCPQVRGRRHRHRIDPGARCGRRKS